MQQPNLPKMNMKFNTHRKNQLPLHSKNISLKVAVSPQVCFAIWTSMMNIHALRNTAGDKATAQPTSGNKNICVISMCNF